METKKPIKKFRAGNITAAIWENTSQKDGKTSTFNTVTFQRSYVDKKDDQWKNTEQMRRNDLPKLALVINKCYEYIVTQNNSKTEEED